MSVQNEHTFRISRSKKVLFEPRLGQLPRKCALTGKKGLQRASSFNRVTNCLHLVKAQKIID